MELAILLIPLVLLFIIATDFARLFYHYTTVTNCARNGALYLSDPVAAANSSYADYQHAALADAQVLTPALSTANVTSSSGTDANGNSYVQVTVSATFNLISPFLPNDKLVSAQALTISRTVQMRVAPTTPK